ncbi:MAG TPA: class I SAM-dependent methyltransferase [Candidatus Baltobacteraceae bacterium]|nr:class I SAM-dependent methyltransferase [Candidatus Baltobacteraceae bacterium]
MSLENDLYTDPKLARVYASVSAGNVCNAEYERPAMRGAVGDPRGLAVLDAGCAAGEHAAWLVGNGAQVTAVDASPAMVALARERLGDRGRVLQADLAQPLPFENASFDTIFSSMTLHYLASWTNALAEFARILRPRGRLVFSTHHPYLTIDPEADYHAVRLVRDRWTGFGPDPIEVQFYHRPLERILSDVVAAGFSIVRLIEPLPTADAPNRESDLGRRLRTQPWFLIVDAVLQ